MSPTVSRYVGFFHLFVQRKYVRKFMSMYKNILEDMSGACVCFWVFHVASISSGWFERPSPMALMAADPDWGEGEKDQDKPARICFFLFLIGAS